MPNPSADEQFVRRALELARKGIGLVSPSPCVGAVLVDPQNNILGEGSYTYAGKTHAEILAIHQAGEKARGSTLYINLEPHSYQSRTPPCTDALIAAGVRRVVASMADPNPKVSGSGFAQLRAAGIEVEVGRMENEARKLNESFAKYVRHGLPLVTLKSAMTLDAKIAPPANPPRERLVPSWITGEAARTHVHELRHQSDAIVVGVGTILADDPLLTDRSGHPRRRSLLRVILDSNLRTPLDSRLIKSANNDVLIFYSTASADKKHAFEDHGIRIEQSASDAEGRVDLSTALHRLAEREITSAIIEGGSTINGATLASGMVDKIFLYYAPIIMGAGVPFTSDSARSEKLNLTQITLHRFDEDVAIEAYLRDPYKD